MSLGAAPLEKVEEGGGDLSGRKFSRRGDATPKNFHKANRTP